MGCEIWPGYIFSLQTALFWNLLTLDNKMHCSWSQTPREKIKTNRGVPCGFVQQTASCLAVHVSFFLLFVTICISVALRIGDLHSRWGSASHRWCLCAGYICAAESLFTLSLSLQHRRLLTWGQIHYKNSLKLCRFKALHLNSDQFFLISQLFLLEKWKIWLKFGWNFLLRKRPQQSYVCLLKSENLIWPHIYHQILP